MNDFIKGVAQQATAILLAAIGAAAIAFISSVAEQSGLDCKAIGEPQEVGLLGGIFKGIHSALVVMRGTMHA